MSFEFVIMSILGSEPGIAEATLPKDVFVLPITKFKWMTAAFVILDILYVKPNFAVATLRKLGIILSPILAGFALSRMKIASVLFFILRKHFCCA